MSELEETKTGRDVASRKQRVVSLRHHTAQRSLIACKRKDHAIEEKRWHHAAQCELEELLCGTFVEQLDELLAN